MKFLIHLNILDQKSFILLLIQKEVPKQLQYIGKLDVSKLKGYKEHVRSKELVLTFERKMHIKEHHMKDYVEIIKNLEETILNPDEILEDLKNDNTVMFIRKISKNSLNVIIKLSIKEDERHPYNSIMTAWIIREKNLQKLKEKNKSIYKNE